MALATATGEAFGGHVAPGCNVRTTAEVLLALLSAWLFNARFLACSDRCEQSFRFCEHIEILNIRMNISYNFVVFINDEQ
jgi:predicted DNA-binding protein with PD1-like motif